MKNNVIALTALLLTLGNQNSTAMRNDEFFVQSQSDDRWEQFNINLRTPWFGDDNYGVIPFHYNRVDYVERLGILFEINRRLADAARTAYNHVDNADYQSASTVISSVLEEIGVDPDGSFIGRLQDQIDEKEPDFAGQSFVFYMFKQNLSTITQLFDLNARIIAGENENIGNALQGLGSIPLGIPEQYLERDLSLQPEQQEISDALMIPWNFIDNTFVISSDFYSFDLIDQLHAIDNRLKNGITSIFQTLSGINIGEEFDDIAQQSVFLIINNAIDQLIGCFSDLGILDDDCSDALDIIQDQISLFRSIFPTLVGLPYGEVFEGENAEMLQALIDSSRFFNNFIQVIDLLERNLFLLGLLNTLGNYLGEVDTIFKNQESSDEDRRQASRNILNFTLPFLNEGFAGL